MENCFREIINSEIAILTSQPKLVITVQGVRPNGAKSFSTAEAFLLNNADHSNARHRQSS